MEERNGGSAKRSRRLVTSDACQKKMETDFVQGTRRQTMPNHVKSKDRPRAFLMWTFVCLREDACNNPNVTISSKCSR